MGRMDISPDRLTLGTKVSLITGAQYRYEGFVAAINLIENTLTLQNVQFWGTENRNLGSGAIHNADNKAPTIGSMFDAITFWMSSIVKLWLVDECNDLGDKGVVKAGTALDNPHNRGCRSRQYWPAAGGGDERLSKRKSPNNGSVGRYNNSMTSPNTMLPVQPRMLVSYPRRGRSGPRSAGNYVPYVPMVSGGRRMNGYMPNYGGNGGQVANNGMRVMGTHPGYVSNNRYAGWNAGYTGNQSMRRMGHPDDRHYTSYNPNGMFVYVPAEIATGYHPRGGMHPRQGGNRRRNAERRGTPKPNLTGPEGEVTGMPPYDFEAANAELEVELAKITLNENGAIDRAVLSTGTESSGLASSVAGNLAVSTGDGVNAHAQSSTTIAGNVLTAAGGNGASGDSSIGAVTSTVNNSLTDTNLQAAIGSSDQLGKGEYYIREKCFFDQISRSETGPRGAPGRNVGGYVVPGQASSANMNSTPAASNSFTTGMSSAAAARRERQLNMETFGQMAAKSNFGGRRRPTRDMLVSAPA